MSKRFKNERCAYCSDKAAITGDHIFAREFFLESARANLPQAPTCAECNKEKSKLEHYLTTVLPFGGRHPDALENLASMVPKRLQKNAKLHRQLAQDGSGREIPIEGDILADLFALIARGLIWYHWKTYLNNDTHAVHASTLTPGGARLYDELLFSRTARDRINESIGNGTFRYEGAQGVDDPAMTVWRFCIYGGLTVRGDGVDEPVDSQVGVITGPKALVDRWDSVDS